MPSPQISNAFAALGLEQSATLESVKTAYKQIALRIHPDKNLDNPDATAEFQRVSEAYRVLVKHFEHPEPHHHHHHGFPGHSYYSPFSHGDFYDDEDEYDDYDDYEEEEDEEIAFFMYLFFNATRRQYARSAHRTRPKVDEESPEQYKARVQRAREEQIASEERRKREAAHRKERIAQEKEEERIQAEQRQKMKLQTKKAQAEAARKLASDKAKEIKRKSQATRSAVFAAARCGQFDRVKKGVWQDSVDASGCEVATGCDEFAKGNPENPRETLLHIAARFGDLELVKWLDSHGADSEEKDSNNFTPFQIALRGGYLSVVQWFLEAYPPKDSDFKAIYTTPDETSLLSLAIGSRQPELVFIVLENKLATAKEMEASWAFLSSAQGQEALKGLNPTANIMEKADDIVKLVSRYGGFSPIPVQPRSTKQAQKAHKSSPSSIQDQDSGHGYVPNQRGSYRGKSGGYRGRGRGKFRGNSRPDV